MDASGDVLLDEDVLCHIFGFLELKERHRTVTLVCKRWRDALDSPLLLRRVKLHLSAASDAPLKGLLRWLHHTAAPHVRQLDLWLEPSRCSGGVPGPTAQLASSLAACGAAGCLRSLCLRVGFPLSLGEAELAPLRSLTALFLESCSVPGDDGGSCALLHLSALGELRRLQELRLVGGRVSLCGALPPALTHLSLDGYSSPVALHCLPSQLEALTGLRSLALARLYSVSPASYNRLSGLTRLQRLSLSACTHLPACLPALTTLRVLRLNGTPFGLYGDGAAVAASLGSALGALRQLSHLALRHVRCLGGGLPAEVTALTQLRRLLWLQQHEGLPPRLPAGPWLAGLRAAALSTAAAAANLPALSAATALQALAAVDAPGSDSARSRYEHFPALAAWAVAHPSLRLLGVCPSELPWLARRTPAARELRARVAHLRSRPSLRIDCGVQLVCELGFQAEDCSDTF